MDSQYARSLIEASLDPLVTINIEGKILDMNHATTGIIGLTREELTGTDFFNYFTEESKAREVSKEVFAKGSVADSPLTLRHKEGKLTDVLFNGSTYKDDQGIVVGIVVVAHDVTDQNRVASELLDAKNAAENAAIIAEKVQLKAESATRIAEDAVKAKQQFLSNMSHEIRTPMNAIIGFTKVLLKTSLNEKQNEYLQAIKLSGDALIVLINDILDLANVDAGKMKFEQIPFKLASSISVMLQLFEAKIQEKNLKLFKEYDKQIPDVLVGDPIRLHQIVLNLVSNAVKFTSEGAITVGVKLISEDEEKVTIEFKVSDTGIGIPPNMIDHIFENFRQANSSESRLYGGTGLGLAIVKQLVEQQGGTIHVKSKVGFGSEFIFKLDFLKTTANVASDIEIIELNDQVKNISVLVIEDIPLNQLLMKTLLDDFGFERDIAENGKIAIEMIALKKYDIILMDLQMPEMNGFQTTEYIRQTIKSNIPIIALTADVTTADLAKCKAVGMNDYLSKPVNEKLLYSKIVSLVIKAEGSVKNNNPKIVDKVEKKYKYIDLDYLFHRTKSNKDLLIEMINLYLEQTPVLLAAMNAGVKNEDWDALQAAVHKMIPSFSIMGISSDFELLAKKVNEYATTMKNISEIDHMIKTIETVCLNSCIELEQELNIIKLMKS